MKQSQLFTKTTKDISKEEVSLNAQLLIRAGFVDKLTAGVYSYLPLGLRVIKKIEEIVRQEMNAVGGQELLMPALSPKDIWEKTGRWDGLDVLFKLAGHDGKDYALGATHEEVVTPLVAKHVFSYRDLPQSVYQIQTKFRNEPRAKSGLLRGREFIMKDLYSFHTDEADLDAYYEKMIGAYLKVYERLGLKEQTYTTYALGGTFSKYSHEFQTVSSNGEDIIFICQSCKNAFNKELIDLDDKKCTVCGGSDFSEAKAIEVGNIFKLKDKYSKPFDFQFADKEGKKQTVLMGCYGIGISRLLGTIVEIHNDERGIVWPENVAPFKVHLIGLGEDEAVATEAERLYKELQNRGIEVLYDDREESSGVKLKDADLIGLPLRCIVSNRTLAKNSVEVVRRKDAQGGLVETEKFIAQF